jgi:NAD(P)H-dependent FMN reductase
MSEESTPSIPVLLGAVRVGRRSVHVARWLLGALDARAGIETELIDLADLELPVMRQRLGETGHGPSGAAELSARLSRAHGLLIVAPEYKNGYPGSLKNAFDYLPAGILRRKPIGIVTVSSGGFGGLNCLAQLRLVCLAMGGLPIPDALPVSRVDEAFDERGNLRDPKLGARAEPFLGELVWYTHALSRQPVKGGEPGSV